MTATTTALADLSLEVSIDGQIPCDEEDCDRDARFRVRLAHEDDDTPCPPDLLCDEHMAETARDAAEMAWECEHALYVVAVSWSEL